MFSHILSCLNKARTLTGIEQDTVFWKSVCNPWNPWGASNVEKIPIRHIVILKMKVGAYNQLINFWEFCPRWHGLFFIFEPAYHPINYPFFKWEGYKKCPNLHNAFNSMSIFKVNLSNTYSTLVYDHKARRNLSSIT